MLKRTIGPYKDFDGKMRDTTWYFDISQPELIELEVEHDAGFEGMIQKIIDTKDRKGLVKIFKSIVLMGVGDQVMDEGVLRFNKSDEIRERFAATMAYNVLFMELATDDEKAAEFMRGVLPELPSDASSDPDKPSAV